MAGREPGGRAGGRRPAAAGDACRRRLAPLRFSGWDRLLTFLGCCCEVTVPSTNTLAFFSPLQREGRRWRAQSAPQPGASPQQCPAAGSAPTPALDLFISQLCFCHGVATWLLLALVIAHRKSLFINIKCILFEGICAGLVLVCRAARGFRSSGAEGHNQKYIPFGYLLKQPGGCKGNLSSA